MQREFSSTELRAPLNLTSICLSFQTCKCLYACLFIVSLIVYLSAVLLVFPLKYFPHLCVLFAFFFCTAVDCFAHPVFRNLFELYFCIISPAALCNNPTRTHATRNDLAHMLSHNVSQILLIYNSPITS